MPSDDESTSEHATGPRTRGEPAAFDTERYRLLDPIGHGGMGEVLAARDEQIGRDVAIKRLRAREPSDRQITRFLHEARIQGRLEHPAIVPVHELGRDANGLPFFAMKKLAGTTLSDMLHARPALQRLLRAFADVCLAIEFAHVHGVIHRDLKPANIVLGDFGEVYVLDWGVAKVIGDSAEPTFDDLVGPGTQTGAMVGTPAYMSPEQIMNATDVDARTDVYALGKVLADILAVDAEPPPELRALVDAATTDSPDARIATSRELGEHVQAYLDGDRDLALRKKLARDHFEHARAAFAAGLGDDDRGVAIRAASSAMALDPTLTGAAELVGRLMLEPPRTMPREVERAIVDEDTSWMFAQGRVAAIANVVMIVLAVPLLVIMGTPIGALVFGAFAATTAFANALALRSRARFRPLPLPALAIVNSAVIAIAAHLFAPIVVAPAMAGISAVVLAASPFLVRRSLVVVVATILGLAVIGPLVIEHVGLLAATIDETDAGMLIHPPAHTAPGMLIPTTTIFLVGLVGVATLIGRAMRKTERGLRRQLHLQAWQLRQLVTG